MMCPDCGSDCWDNRQNKRNPRAPDFKCKNKQCNKAVWETPRQSNGPQPSNGPAPVQHTTKPPLSILYNECLDFANKACKHYFGNGVATSDIVAAAATLFIQAVRDGTPIRAPKLVPDPPPPPPPAPDPAYAQSTPGPLPFD